MLGLRIDLNVRNTRQSDGKFKKPDLGFRLPKLVPMFSECPRPNAAPFNQQYDPASVCRQHHFSSHFKTICVAYETPEREMSLHIKPGNSALYHLQSAQGPIFWQH